ncbi:Uma2 family endonuclease [Streptosporangium sp. NPDC050280]|uniref:Uma2 family endonuclease n=1 Tax=unclassified Streptosporangium TaxID=2632669 RepID=UPI0034295E11
MTESSLPAWAFPPPEGFVAADLDRISQLPAHTELIDGSLVFVSPQASFHTSTMYLLETGLNRTIPKDLRARREMSVVLGERQRPEPDISVIHASAEHSPEQTFYRAEDVVLVVEVISPTPRSATATASRRCTPRRASHTSGWSRTSRESPPSTSTSSTRSPGPTFSPVSTTTSSRSRRRSTSTST